MAENKKISNDELDARKCFGDWIDLKSKLHYMGVSHEFREGDVWWCAVGENVGIEINGKNQEFSRPVLVLKKLSKMGFLGVPLTSQAHEGTWYVPFVFKNRKQVAVLSQVRTFSVFRLYEKMGTVPDSDLELVKTGFHKLYK